MKGRTLFLLAALAAMVTSARSAVLRTLYLDEMAAESAVVVHATVTAARSESGSGSIRTVYTARAHQYLRGLLGESFEFSEPGGISGNVGLYVPGAPQFQAGEQVLLFLWTDGGSGRYQAIGFEQGVLRLREEDGRLMANRRIPIRGGAQAAASRAGMGPQGQAATSRELSRLLEEIAAAIAQSNAGRGAAMSASGKEAR